MVRMVITGLWIAFVLSWVAASGWSSTVDKSVGMKREVPSRLLLVIGALILFVPAHGYEGPLRLWRVTYAEAWVLTGAIASGLAFAWWARIHLGVLWSARVTTKENHRVIDTGPYAVVRHPIYTGILFAIYATAAVKGTALAWAAAAIITTGLWMKARLEEQWLRTQLGPAYGEYRRRVPMLLPFGPKGA
jgi:protein-S-isoprenylcysteine O-methyltransferase Ste14